MMRLRPSTPADVQAIVREHRGLIPVGRLTKPALSQSSAERVVVDMSAFSGLMEYQPEECTFTARAATPLADIEAALAEHGQYLPFDPPFVARGATLGGTVAAGLSGPGRYRYGGVRDFLLGVHFVDGEGQIVRGGGRVVKNAAGFGLQHLLLGSLGRAGILLDLTFKVFPHPRAWVTLIAEYPTTGAALDSIVTLRRSVFEIDALDLTPPGTLLLRQGGDASALPGRAGAVAAALGVPVRELHDDEERRVWNDARDLAWVPPTAALVKVALTPRSLLTLDEFLDVQGAARRYSAGGEVAWIGWSEPIARLDRALDERSLSGLVLAGAGSDPLDDPFLGRRPSEAFLTRVRRALDPRGVFAQPESITGATALPANPPTRQPA